MEVPTVRPAWLDQAEVEVLRELLGFRHFFRHVYGAKYRPERLEELCKLAVALWPRIKVGFKRAQELVETMSREVP